MPAFPADIARRRITADGRIVPVRHGRRRRRGLLGVGLVTVVLLAAQCAPASETRPGSAGSVTPVSGPSWLSRAGLSVTTSKMGALGGETAATAPHEPPFTPAGRGFGVMGRLFGRSTPATAGAFVLTGADLYRFSCQSCHGPTGNGDPPAVNSLLSPVRGTSQALLAQRLGGAAVSPKFMAGLLAEARADLTRQIVQGGKQMPPFADLRPAEMQALIHYLNVLAGVPDAGAAPAPVRESALRVGQLVVGGTCQVCHDATGPGGMAATMRGLVPSLASLTEQDSVRQVVDKVRLGVNPRGMMGGRGGRMGMGGMMGGGGVSGGIRMPKLPYLTRSEIAAAYAYLRQMRPRP